MGGGVSSEERHVKSDIEVKFTPLFVRHESENMRHGGRSEEQAKVPASADGFGWSGRTIFQGLKMLLKF